jgi:hypothetical protein
MTVNLGELADKVYTKSEEIAKINAKLKVLEAEKRDLENTILTHMDQAGTDIARGKKATVSISESERFSIQDFDELTPFIHRKKAYHLFERRISANAAREMIESLGGKMIPGLSRFTQRRLNVRKV